MTSGDGSGSGSFTATTTVSRRSLDSGDSVLG